MRRLLPIALAALLGLTLLPGLAAVDALDEREARDAITAYESTQGREWLSPIYGHEPFFEKPLAGLALEVVARRVLTREDTPQGGTAEGGTADVAVSRALRAGLAAVRGLVGAAVGGRGGGARGGWLGAG
ncbi:MAG: hypothetical protein ACHP85_24575, partial [Burkholderiales bacterium]